MYLHLTRDRFPGLKEAFPTMNRIWQRRPAQVGIVLLLTVIYIAAFILAYPRVGPGVGALLVLPLVGAAWFIGLKAALLVWLLSFPLQAMLFHLVGVTGLDAFIRGGGIPGMFAGLVVSVVVGHMHDLSQSLRQELAERKKAVAALRQSEHFVHRITEATLDVVYVFDLVAQRRVYSNRNLSSVLGYEENADPSAEHALFLNRLHPDDAVKLRELQDRYKTAQDGDIVEVEYQLRNASDEWRTFYCRETIFSRNPDRSPREIVGTAHDITERKRATENAREKERLQDALMREKEGVQFKNRFMTIISHEFRTPLSVIQSSSEILDRYYDLLSPQRRSDCVATIKTHVQHVTDMLNDISLVVAGETQYLELKPVPTNLEVFCRQIADDLTLAKAYPINLITQGDLRCVAVDTRLLQHILNNLLSNAIKYSPNGRPIDLEVKLEGSEVVFTIRDEGIGIPAADLDRVYDTFYRASNVGIIGGTGLGLRIVRDYVKLHQGTIDLRSEEGKGTTVTVRFPVQQV